ncbi:MAG: AAC(3) family N-acetyltransferase, partial [Pyrinomonadaceae bacterium]
GRFDGKNAAQNIIAAIIEYLGENGTLVAPTFNFDFCKGETFDRQNTTSKNMGVLSESVRLFPGSERSLHPMQSVAAIGKFAANICERNTPSAFSPGGSFDRLLKLNAKLLLFGVNFNAASFFHYAEEDKRVPYRYFKSFSGEYIDRGVSEKRENQLYVRYLELNPQLNLRNLEARMDSEGNLRKAKLGMGEILVCDFKDLYETACEMLEKDLLIFVKNKEEVREKLNNQSVKSSI